MPCIPLTVALLSSLLIAAPTTAQTTSNSGPPRTPWGVPNLNGVWDFRTATPLQRLSSLGGKATFTEEEATAVEQAFADGLGGGNATQFPGATDADFEVWFDMGTRLTDRRTSLIVDPPDGRIPERTAAGQARVAAQAGLFQRAADGPEDRALRERCLTTRLPITPEGAPNWLQVFQTEQHVAIFIEESHDARVVPLESAEAVSPAVRQWKGSLADTGRAIHWSSKHPISMVALASLGQEPDCSSWNDLHASTPQRSSMSLPSTTRSPSRDRGLRTSRCH